VPSASGARSRNRTIIQTPANGGVPCPNLVEQTGITKLPFILAKLDIFVHEKNSERHTNRLFLRF